MDDGDAHLDPVSSVTDPIVVISPVYTAIESAISLLRAPRSIKSLYSFLIGLSLVLGASVLNALGLNLAKRDHNEAAKLPPDQRSSFRFMTVLGMGLYVLSQLIGSSLALQYLRAQWVAPLSSTSLIANLPLARWLCGTAITRLDLIGTGVVILGVVGVVGFSNLKRAGSIDEETSLDLASLKRLWGRGGWIAYFVILEVASLLVLWTAHIMSDILREREELEPEHIEEAERIMKQRREAREEQGFWKRLVVRQRLYRRMLKAQIERILHSRSDISVRKWSALLWALSGGAIAGQTLVYAKELLKLISNGEPSQFASPLVAIIAVLLAATAVTQIICLNKGLAAFLSTLVVPCFFAMYAAISFLTSLIALDQTGAYSTGVLVLISFSLLVLTAGVFILASKPPDKPIAKTEADDDEVELDAKRAPGINGLLAEPAETVWEVGDSTLDESAYTAVEGEEEEEFGELQSPVPVHDSVP